MTEGKIYVVTGGSQGLGKAIARRLASGGAAGIVITGRDTAKGAAAAEALSRTGARVEFVGADLADVEQCHEVMRQSHRLFGRLDGLVNAAGFTERSSILEITPEFFDHSIAVNLRAPLFLMQDAVRQMRACGAEGTIVNILTMAIHGAMPELVAYQASKAALASATRNTAAALLADRIRVNGLALGWTSTPGEDAIQRRFHSRDAGWMEGAGKDLPFGRLIDPDEVAEFVAFLSSPLSGVMTGSVIDYDQRVSGHLNGPPPRRLVDPAAV